MAVASGGEPGTGEEDQRSGGPVVDLQPNFETIQVGSKNIKDIYMITTSTNVYYFTTNPILG